MGGSEQTHTYTRIHTLVILVQSSICICECIFLLPRIRMSLCIYMDTCGCLSADEIFCQPRKSCTFHPSTTHTPALARALVCIRHLGHDFIWIHTRNNTRTNTCKGGGGETKGEFLQQPLPMKHLNMRLFGIFT